MCVCACVCVVHIKIHVSIDNVCVYMYICTSVYGDISHVAVAVNDQSYHFISTQLPTPNASLLSRLLRLSKAVLENGSMNNMSAGGLGTVFAPSCMFPILPDGSRDHAMEMKVRLLCLHPRNPLKCSRCSLRSFFSYTCGCSPFPLSVSLLSRLAAYP